MTRRHRKARPPGSVPRSGRLAAAALTLVAAAALGCGKKGPPHPPPRLIPAQTTDLEIRQTGDRIVLDLSYPAVTTGGLPLPAVEALEVLTLRPRPLPGGEAVPRIEPGPFVAGSSVATRIEGPLLAAATRGSRLTVELDASPGSPYGPLAAAASEGAAGTAQAPTATEPEVAAAAEAEAGTDATPTPTPGPPALLAGVRTYGPRRNQSPLSNLVGIVPQPAPAPPATVAVTSTADGIEVRWTAPEGAPVPRGWEVLRRQAGETAFETRIARVAPDRLDHLDPSAAFGERYEYTVRTAAAIDPLVESADGPVQAVEHADVFPPPTPTGLVALAEEASVRLLWNRVEAPDLAGYRLYRSRAGEAEIELQRDPGAGTTDHVDRTLDAGVEYSYRVTAFDRSDNESAPSEPATATPR